MSVVDVRTPSRAYEVHVGNGVLDRTGELVRAAAGGRMACVVSDSHVAPLYAGRVEASLAAADYETRQLSFPAGERHKTIQTWAGIVEGLAEAGMARDDVVVAVGGGVTGDMAGFAAACYMRGCAVAQVPTSLLAMVDSSVGGKTAVDISAGKNLCGAFLQPRVVVADVACLGTLSPELFADSCGEVIKHGVLADPALFDELAAHPLTERGADGLDYERLVRVVTRNVEIKRDVVNADERERGLRQTLNLGHTLGHAIEAASDYRLGHGASVAAGLCCVARATAAWGLCDPGLPAMIERCVAAHGLPTGTELGADEVYRWALADKKRHGSTINVVLPLEIGRCELRTLTLDEFAELVRLGTEAGR